jgi:hypothetical protein
MGFGFLRVNFLQDLERMQRGEPTVLFHNMKTVGNGASERGEPSATVDKSSATGFGKLLVANKSSGTRQTSASSPKGADRRGSLIGGGRRQLGGGRDEGNLGKKTLLGA